VPRDARLIKVREQRVDRSAASRWSPGLPVPEVRRQDQSESWTATECPCTSLGGGTASGDVLAAARNMRPSTARSSGPHELGFSAVRTFSTARMPTDAKSKKLASRGAVRREASRSRGRTDEVGRRIPRLHGPSPSRSLCWLTASHRETIWISPRSLTDWRSQARQAFRQPSPGSPRRRPLPPPFGIGWKGAGTLKGMAGGPQNPSLVCLMSARFRSRNRYTVLCLAPAGEA